MDIIKTILKISKRKDLSFCDDKNERNGKHGSICVFKNDDFVGKIRWPKSLVDGTFIGFSVDKSLEEELKRKPLAMGLDSCVKVIKAFEPVNPSVGRLYGMKAQRDASNRLIAQYSEEVLFPIIELLSTTNLMPFAPVITTPTQLEAKIGALQAFIAREESKLSEVKKKIGIAF